jgi:large subunit ribosomal protein L24
MIKFRKGDEVVMLTGKDKGKRGIVLKRVDLNYFLVEGINSVKKATKPNPMAGVTGGILDKLMPVHISNIAIYNNASGKSDRVSFKVIEGKKFRVLRSSGEMVKG